MAWRQALTERFEAPFNGASAFSGWHAIMHVILAGAYSQGGSDGGDFRAHGALATRVDPRRAVRRELP